MISHKNLFSLRNQISESSFKVMQSNWSKSDCDSSILTFCTVPTSHYGYLLSCFIIFYQIVDHYFLDLMDCYWNVQGLREKMLWICFEWWCTVCFKFSPGHFWMYTVYIDKVNKNIVLSFVIAGVLPNKSILIKS